MGKSICYLMLTSKICFCLSLALGSSQAVAHFRSRTYNELKRAIPKPIQTEYVLNKYIWFGSSIILKSEWGLTETTCKRNVTIKAIIMTRVFSLFCSILLVALCWVLLGTLHARGSRGSSLV